MSLLSTTTALCQALHNWNAFERAQLGGSDVEMGASIGRAAAFVTGIPPWPAPARIDVRAVDPNLLVPTFALSAHAQIQRARLLDEAQTAWKAWEHALAREVPALWPALAMPRLTLHTNGHTGSLSHHRLTFLQVRTNLGKPMLDTEHLPIPVFAERVCMLLAPLRALPKARGLWALGGPNHTGGSHKAYALKGPVVPGAGPAEAAACAAALVRPYATPFVDTGAATHWLEQGAVALPSAGARRRTLMGVSPLIQAMAAGVWNPQADGLV